MDPSTTIYLALILYKCNTGHSVYQCHHVNDYLCRQPRHPCHISLHWSLAQRNCTPLDLANHFHPCLSPQRCQTAPPFGTKGVTQTHVIQDSNPDSLKSFICANFHSCIHPFIHPFNCFGGNGASKAAQTFLHAWIHRGASNHTLN